MSMEDIKTEQALLHRIEELEIEVRDLKKRKAVLEHNNHKLTVWGTKDEFTLLYGILGHYRALLPQPPITDHHHIHQLAWLDELLSALREIIG